MGGGIVVILTLTRPALGQEIEPDQPRPDRREGFPRDIAAWLHIQPDGHIRVFTGKVEMGQNIRTSLSQAVAGELHAELAAVELVMGDTRLTPFDRGTYGSRTTPQMGTQLRQMAAAARALLLRLAARQWHVDTAHLSARDGKVMDPASGRTLSYAELARGQALTETVPLDQPTTPAREWSIAGRSVHKVGARAMVTGEHKFTPDLKRPGMLYGKVVRPAAFGATLVSADVSRAQTLAGVRVVREGDFLAVTAPDTLAAERAAAAIRAQWKTTPQISGQDLFAFLKQHAERGDDRIETGSVESALATAAQRLRAVYSVAYIQHAPLETRAALAEWSNGHLTVWTGTQRPFAVQEALAAALGVRLDRVRVIVPDTGGAFGGKHTAQQATEAARLARAVGKPVQVRWTREEEFTWAYFRPAGVIEIRSGLSADGRLTAWDYHNYNSGPAAIATMYDVANQHIEFHPVAHPPLAQGSYRSLAAAANHFARESHMDELAHAARLDPLAFRLKHLRHPRLRTVLETAAGRFGWARRARGGNRGYGLAGGIEKGGHVACCAEVAVDPAQRTARIVRVTEAFDCGAIVNPDELENSIAGAIGMGIGGALFEAIAFDHGRVLNPHFAQYRVPRFRDQPRIEVVLVDRQDEPSFGAGETPIVGLAPAVANAIFDATGVRLRSMPLLPGGQWPAQA